jgi:hypothetical protein
VGQYAERTYFRTNETGSKMFYIDLDTIRHKRKLVKIWMLTDEKIEQKVKGKSYLSSTVLQQYDCEEETFQILVIYYRSVKMGEGELFHSETGLANGIPFHRIVLPILSL